MSGSHHVASGSGPPSATGLRGDGVPSRASSSAAKSSFPARPPPRTPRRRSSPASARKAPRSRPLWNFFATRQDPVQAQKRRPVESSCTPPSALSPRRGERRATPAASTDASIVRSPRRPTTARALFDCAASRASAACCGTVLRRRAPVARSKLGRQTHSHVFDSPTQRDAERRQDLSRACATTKASNYRQPAFERDFVRQTTCAAR